MEVAVVLGAVCDRAGLFVGVVGDGSTGTCRVTDGTGVSPDPGSTQVVRCSSVLYLREGGGDPLWLTVYGDRESGGGS